jgi:hypothetical protein
LKGFRSHFHSPFLDFSWRYRDELPPSHPSCLRSVARTAYRGRGCMSGLEVKAYRSFCSARGGFWTISETAFARVGCRLLV